MLFQTYYRLDPWGFEPPIESFAPLRFDLTDQKFSLYIQYIHGCEEDESSPELLIRALHTCDDVPDEIVSVFKGDSEGPLDFRGGDGFSCYPQSYREFILHLHAHMDRSATDLLNVIRWRFGIYGGQLALTSEWAFMHWHDDRDGEKPFDDNGFLNRQVPAGPFSLILPEVQSVDLNRESADAIEEMCRLGTAQPLYHDLFREAWQNRSHNPRSALVMAIAAAETAFKTAAVELCDDKGTEWIFENLPSPPLDRMLREYLQLLPVRRKLDGEVRRPPKSAIRVLKEGIELRNKLVHGRDQGVNPDQLNMILLAVRDILYLLDFYQGHDWAIDRLSCDFGNEIRRGTA